jgi:hypothetical protein
LSYFFATTKSFIGASVFFKSTTAGDDLDLKKEKREWYAGDIAS